MINMLKQAMPIEHHRRKISRRENYLSVGISRRGCLLPLGALSWPGYMVEGLRRGLRRRPWSTQRRWILCDPTREHVPRGSPRGSQRGSQRVIQRESQRGSPHESTWNWAFSRHIRQNLWAGTGYKCRIDTSIFVLFLHITYVSVASNCSFDNSISIQPITTIHISTESL